MVHQNVEIKADAINRAWRTFGQGALVAALVAVGEVLTHLGETPDWKAVATVAATAAGTAVVTFIHNKVSPVK